ncbi:prepilin peptidase [Thermus sp.]|uniref:prepilin peptidase n=1 Tax=Thermus sp. TaxID=275 RepID=UPI00391D773D
MWPLFALLLGLAVGSFLNVVIHRLPKGESIVFPPSRCPACGHRLAPKDLVPVFSYLALRGRCRYCHSPISPRYPLVEALTGLLFALVALFYPPSPQAFLTFAFLAFLVALSFIDLDTLELPDSLTYGLLFLGLASAYLLSFPRPFPEALDGALISAGVLGLVAGYGGFFLRRFREARAEVPVGPHQVHMAALFGALLGAGVGMALAFLTWALSGRTGRPVVLPDRITLPLLPLAWILAPYLGAELLSTLKGSFLAAGGLALAGGLYWALRTEPQGEVAVKAEAGETDPVAMGYGDVKLLGALGAWLGIYSLLALFLGVFAGALVGLAFRQRQIPFGPYLALGGVVAFFFGETLWRAYMAWLGL